MASRKSCWLVLLLLGCATLGRPLGDALVPPSVAAIVGTYFSNEEMADWLRAYTQRCSGISQLTSFGKSAGGVDLYALEISNTAGQDTGKPHVKYVANIHGNEPSGRQLLLALAEKLCLEYDTNKAARALVDSVHLFLVPSMNPDGFALKQRENKANVDLNRNFPDPLRPPPSPRLQHRKAGPHADQQVQPEVQAMMDFTLSHRFVASLSFHEGALVANYPLDGYPDGSQAVRKVKQAAADDRALVHISTLYAQLHTTMARSKEFPGGITNGAQWYPLYGGMQDWNYLVAGCMDVTLELEERKWPKPPQLAAVWEENERALVEWPLAAALGGLRGRVLGAAAPNMVGAPLLAAKVQVQGLPLPAVARKGGAFHRVLAPGTYNVTISAAGYIPQTKAVTVPGASLRGYDFTLVREGGAPTTPRFKVINPAALELGSKQPPLSSSSNAMASNQRVLGVMALQVLVLGGIIMWRRRRGSSGGAGSGSNGGSSVAQGYRSA